MNYLVTGATGFIGRFLVARLLARRASTVYVLTRKSRLRLFANIGAGEAVLPASVVGTV